MVEDRKIALVFPGQGSQEIGMGKNFYNGDAGTRAKELFEQANEILGFNLEDIVFRGSPDALARTNIAQPAIYVVNALCYDILRASGILDDKELYFAGHSAGELAAAYAARVFDFPTGLKIIKSRAEFMHEASIKNPGKMAAILGLTEEQLRGICNKVPKDYGAVEIANLNCPGQIVISGTNKAVDEASRLVKELSTKPAEGSRVRGARVYPLKVSGAFHSSLMREAGDSLERELERFYFNPPVGHLVQNYGGEEAFNPDEIKRKLAKQIYSIVQWEKSVRYMIAKGVKTFVEVGHGKVLSGLIHRTNHQVNVYNVQDYESLEDTLRGLRK